MNSEQWDALQTKMQKLKVRFANVKRPDVNADPVPATMERTVEIRKFERESKKVVFDEVDGAPF